MTRFISFVILVYLFDVILTVLGMIDNGVVDPYKTIGLVVKLAIVIFLYDRFSPDRKVKRTMRRNRKYLEMLSPEQWLLESTRFYGSFGFFDFAGKSAMSDQDVTQEIIRIRNEGKDALQSVFLPQDPCTGFDPEYPGEDILLLQCDTTRVWVFSTEHISENTDKDSYKKFLEQWGSISRGVFTPTDIDYSEHEHRWESVSGEEWERREELWRATLSGDPEKDYENEQKWIPVRFRWNGRPLVIHFPHPYERWWTAKPFRELNELIKDSGYQFVWHIFDEHFLLTVLKPDEQKQIEEGRGWRFNSSEFRY
ncbi:hypothetical protein HZA86_05105 [Candidatus Uhrbacteria bacterium]|nr:hypothetical protein [Candidatus Uhrbacteria bacterium]